MCSILQWKDRAISIGLPEYSPASPTNFTSGQHSYGEVRTLVVVVAAAVEVEVVAVCIYGVVVWLVSQVTVGVVGDL
jgi:hypothetical protein